MSFALLSYDVANDNRRTRLARFLKDYGQRIQYSVFEVFEEEAELKMPRR